jgi:hypothetical protein
METAPLKSFATRARTTLIREVTARVAVVLAPGSPERVEQPKAIAALESAVSAADGGEKGRAAVADRVAYTWFNRIIALRFMDASRYTGIGVVSPQAGVEGGQPEILAAAKRGNIDGAVVGAKTRELVTDLLNGTRRSTDPEGEAFALLLTEYCRHWNRAMPFMFEREGDYTELLIPANLLADDSVLSRAVKVLTTDVCQDVEVIGWLYQFYISERKDQVFAGFKKNKKAGAAEIPAATQLFTPHWIVRYLVENSVGRLWMLNHPSSRLVDQMDYYIAPVDEETNFLKISGPEELTVIDPACGSGHMLTYAFDLLYAIYEEEGYAPSEIPSLILTHNLHGTEIDPRAGTLAAFALTMKARARQRTFFNKQVEPTICVLEPIRFTPTEIDFLLTRDGDKYAEAAFWSQFEHADVFGSLIRPNPELTAQLKPHGTQLDDGADILLADVFDRAKRVLLQAECLSRRYSVAIANPPYMGSSNMLSEVAAFARENFPDSKADLFAMFIERSTNLAIHNGYIAMVTMHSWMFIHSFKALRDNLRAETAATCFVHLGIGAFSELNSKVVSTVAFVLRAAADSSAKAPFMRLVEVRGELEKARALRQEASVLTLRSHVRSWDDLGSLPDGVISYWLTDTQVRLLTREVPLAAAFPITAGISTGDNSRFFRFWPEVSAGRIKSGGIGGPWVLHHKGGPERRWYGNVSHVLRYDAESLSEMGRLPGFRHDGNASYFRPHIGWTALTNAAPSFRYIEKGHTFGSGSKALIANEQELLLTLGVLNSRLAVELLQAMSPTLNFEVGHIGRLPTLRADNKTSLAKLIEEIIAIAREDWNEQENSFGFKRSPILQEGSRSLRETVQGYVSRVRDRSDRLTILEDEAEADVRRAFGVDGTVEPHHKASAAQGLKRLVEDLISYAVGCMFGRYSLDAPGLVLADQGDALEDYLARVPVPSFWPDVDNVIPIVDGEWFEDDIVARFREFIRVAFGEKHFEENLRFVTESLGVKNLQDYFLKSFYADHVKRYKKRPIYWLFSSPKGSFNALIYMHRYTPSTIGTVLNEYLREYAAKLKASLAQQERLAAGDGSPREQAAALKEAEWLRKVLTELEEYEHDILYPLASRQIAIDLDDGVKANYPKFGAALKKIPGLEASDE